MLKTIVATALLAATTALYAQTPAPAAPSGADKGAKREEMREKMKAARENAKKACEGKKGDDHASCMEQQFCSQAPDPAKCQERIEKRKARRQADKK